MAKIIGAIRWDVWYSQPDDTVASARATLRSVGQTAYQDRAPFWYNVVSTNAVANDYSQATMDQEIDFAVAGTIDYWAFLQFSTTSAATNALNLYLSSTKSSLVKFCMITSAGVLGTTASHATEVAYLVALMLRSNYQKVLTNRPLLYILYNSSEVASNFTNDVNFKTVIDEIRAGVISGGGADPYIVSFGGSGASAASHATALGCDAISGYNAPAPSGTITGLFSQVDTTTQAYWDEMKATTKKIIPICHLGWDGRPRIARPVPWQITTQMPYFGMNVSWAQPSTSEITAQISDALAYLTTYSTECEAQALLVYAWNEHDEGGWLCPTLSQPNGERLAAVAAAR